MHATETTSLEEQAFSVSGMNCASCVAHVQKSAIRAAGVQECDVNLARGRAVVRFDPAQTDSTQIADAITRAGYPAEPEAANDNAAHAEHLRMDRQAEEARAWKRRAIVGTLLWLPLEATHWLTKLFESDHSHTDLSVGWMIWASLIASTLAIVFVGSGFYRSAWGAMKRLTSNMDTLIAMGASVAYGYSAVSLAGYFAGWWGTLPDLYFMEAAGLLALISLGHWLESRARQSAGSAIRELLELAPETAMRLSSADATHVDEVPVSQLIAGDIVLVRPGDRVPIDGVVVKGPSSVNESMITGESAPVKRDDGDDVIGGTQNIDGRLIVRVTKVGAETALAQIVKLVERAQASKPAIQRLADQIAAIFVPAVLGIALLTGIGWYVWGITHDWSSGQTWGRIALAVCSVLIIACPCALGLAVPAALMVGTGRGAKKGILIRDIDTLQSARRINTIVLDKTGTITMGRPMVARIHSMNGASEEEILALAASAEQHSEHPIARAIVGHARDRAISLRELAGFNNEPGYGVAARVGDTELLVGSAAMMEKHQATGMSGDFSTAGETAVYVAARRTSVAEIIGAIFLSDEIKPEAAGVIDQLHKLGLRIVLLTGDTRGSAEKIAKQVGIDDVRAEVKPDQKAQAVRDLQASGATVAMVGDGINDAPALAQADVGIAVGSGADIAKQTSGVVLVGGSLAMLPVVLRLSGATMRTIHQNLFFAFLYNVLAIPLAATGILSPYIAAAAMALSDVTVIGNALLLRRSKID
jgi:Cu+-exporting ATPase